MKKKDLEKKLQNISHQELAEKAEKVREVYDEDRWGIESQDDRLSFGILNTSGLRGGALRKMNNIGVVLVSEVELDDLFTKEVVPYTYETDDGQIKTSRKIRWFFEKKNQPLAELLVKKLNEGVREYRANKRKK